MTSRLRYCTTLFLLILPAFLCAGEDWTPNPIGPFLGLNDRDSSFAIPAQNSSSLLNVELTPGGRSVRKRKGYGLQATLAITTSPVHGIYTFFDSNGNTVDLYFNDTRIAASVGGSSVSTLVSTATFGGTWQCTDSLGSAYCASSNREPIIKTNGVTVTGIATSVSTGTMLATCVTRLAMAGFSGSPSLIAFSQDGDFTTWTTGSLGISGVQFTINSPGAKITHITYAFGRLMWFKDTSFGYILIGNQPLQTDWAIRTVSYDVGTNDNSSIYREGVLYFRSRDGHFYAYDGSNYRRISREIAGTIGLTQTRGTNFWTQTSQSDFQAGVSTPTSYLSFTISTNSVVLSTANSVAYQIDTTSSDFASGTLTNTSTTVINGSVTLAFVSTEAVKDSYTAAACCSGGACSGYYMAQSFSATSNYHLSSIDLNVLKTGSPSNANVYVLSNNSNTPGSVLSTGTLLASAVTGSAAYVNVTMSPNIQISTGTRYWVQIVEGSPCATDSFLWTYRTAEAPYTEFFGNGTDLNHSAQRQYKVYGKNFNTSGNIVSRTFDVGTTTGNTNWNWCEFVPNGSFNGNTLTYETQTSSSSTGVFTSLVSVSSRTSPTSLVQRFIRYKASFSTLDVGISPQLDDVTMNACFIPSFYSSVKNATALTSWDAFSATYQNNDGTQLFFIRSSSNSIAVNSSTPSWTSITNGAIPTVSTGTNGVFFQIRDQFSITNTTQAPKLDEFTQNWFEGSAADKMYCTYFDDKLLFSVTNGTGATTNNKDLVYDIMNQTWLVWDIPSNGFLVRNNRLYFGHATSGYIFKYGDIDNDNGSAINAYWRSKDFFGGDPFTVQELANISVVAKSVQNSTATITYTLNGSSSTSYSMSLYNSNGNFLNKNKNLSAGTIANNSWSVQFGNNAVDQPFEIFGAQVGIRERSWIPTP